MKNAEIHGASMQKENPEQKSRQFATVESIDDYVDKAQQLGAKVIKNKQEISKGYYTVLGDPKIPLENGKINNINNKLSSIIFSFFNIIFGRLIYVIFILVLVNI
ncbi:MAG: hypothetical protein ICV56_01825 [Nitrososphaeraceae archaeon]|nr:hypothetical protein [Nitrososphaeraceae archaeon]